MSKRSQRVLLLALLGLTLLMGFQFQLRPANCEKYQNENPPIGMLTAVFRLHEAYADGLGLIADTREVMVCDLFPAYFKEISK